MVSSVLKDNGALVLSRSPDGVHVVSLVIAPYIDEAVAATGPVGARPELPQDCSTVWCVDLQTPSAKDSV